MTEATAIGWRAHAALTATGGIATVIAPLSGSLYVEADGELLWIGLPGAALHARVILARDIPRGDDPSVRVGLGDVAPWRPSAQRVSSTAVRDGARALRAVLAQAGEPRGLGRLLVPDATDDPVMARARPHALALAHALVMDDTARLADAARPLLGLGTGLTPAADDYVGGLLFTRRVIADAEPPGWNAAVARIVADAGALTHPISARLLADLAAGEGWAPLHDLVAALAQGNLATALVAARAMTTLGHSPGWDVFAGGLAGILGPAALVAPTSEYL
jgi:hypothetical protein